MANASREKALRTELERFVDVVAADPSVRRIMIFGSLARGVVDDWSDLDIVVLMDTDLPFLTRLRLLQDRVPPRIATDLLVYTPDEWARLTKTRPFIRDEIAAKCRTVYDRSLAALA